MKKNILIGGKAGQGPNILSELVAKGLLAKGYYVFYYRDYQSLIRGGHNFNVVSFSDKPISSNSSSLDIFVALDENTEKIHASELNKNTIILKDSKENMFYAGTLFKALGIDFNVLEQELKNLKNFEKNIEQAKLGYEQEKQSLNLKTLEPKKLSFMNGSQAVSEGAIKSGLDLYYAYPMTPATGVLMDLAQEMKNPKNKHLTIELENEIAVINAAIGSAIVGKKAMLGTSGGGFDLMTEALSLTGIAEIPLVLYLAQRPGPATGVATYTGQGDLNMALHAGHGEFSRLVVAPGTPKECIELTSEAFYFAHKYRIPAIILSDKHVAESKYSSEGESKITESKILVKGNERFNSYEKDSEGSATEDSELIIKNIDARKAKAKEFNKEIEKFTTHKIHGKKDSKNLIVSWGSTKGAIHDAIEHSDLNAKFLQILYMEPFSKKIQAELEKADNIIVVENNATSPLSDLIRQETGVLISDKNKILKYDGRPFTSTEIENKLKGLLK